MQSLLQGCTVPLQVGQAAGEAGDAEVTQVSLGNVQVATVDAFQVRVRQQQLCTACTWCSC